MMLYYTHAFCLTYGIRRVKINREYIVSVIQLRHAKVVRSGTRYPQKKPVACIRPGIASAGGSFPREDSWEEYMRWGRRAWLLLLPLVAVAEAVVLVRD